MNEEALDLTPNQESTNHETQPENPIVDNPKDLNNLTRAELLEHLRDVLQRDIQTIKEEVDAAKQSFYRKLKSETEEQKKEFLESGGEDIDFLPVRDELDEEFKALLDEYRTKRSEIKAQLEAEKEQNLLEKQHIIDRMKVLTGKKDDVSTHINEFRDLQKKWKDIGHVPIARANELWKHYNRVQEEFWDLVKINFELREYDFKKNLESKTELCERAEVLAEQENVLEAFNELQKLHEKWREIGPVARELREEIWQRFKEASTIINRKHQGHFEELRKLEEENLQEKIALCEKIESFDYSQLDGYKAWDEATKQIMAWQEEWRAIGFAPRKANREVFGRYRAACDTFFKAKSEFYKASKSQVSENLEKKRALCAKAEALKENTDWSETSEIFIQLQKEWKETGHVPRKYSNELWKRFIGACDYFFEQRSKHTDGEKSQEKENSIQKKELIQQIEALDSLTDKEPQEVLTLLREYMSQWNTIGHVPYREKDKVYKKYRSAVNKMFEKLNVDSNQRRLESFKSNLQELHGRGDNRMLRERDKLMRVYDNLKAEIATYENNIGFLTSTNKKGSSVIKEMERKIQALRDEILVIEQKISMIDENLA